MFPHQFGRLVENRVILNQNQVWDVRSYLTRAEFDRAMVLARHGDAFFTDVLDLDFRVIASDRYRYPFCEANRDGQTFWEVPGSHLTFDEEARRTEVEFLTMTVGSNVVPVR